MRALQWLAIASMRGCPASVARENECGGAVAASLSLAGDEPCQSRCSWYDQSSWEATEAQH